MAGRRNRHRHRKPKVDAAAAEVVVPWSESDLRAMRRNLLDKIHRYYLDAVSRLPAAELRNPALARALLVAGHCYGPLHPVHNIILNSLWYAASSRPRAGHHLHDDEFYAVLSADGILRACNSSLDGLLAALRHCCPSLSAGDALWHLFSAGADLASAVALANGTSKPSAQTLVASEGVTAFHRAAKAARHPNLLDFPHFAASLLPAIDAQHNIARFLLTNHQLSTRHANYLSKLLAPPSPPPAFLPPQPPLILSPQVLDHIASQKKHFNDTAKQVLNVANTALQLRQGEQLMLHSVCGASLLELKDKGHCYHINFLAYNEGSGSAVGAPVLFFAEAIVLACGEMDIRLCTPVDLVADIGCCFACESNRKKLVHPSYDEHLGGREFQLDEVDDGGDFPNPLDVDYIFFHADRDRDFANYLEDQFSEAGRKL